MLWEVLYLTHCAPLHCVFSTINWQWGNGDSGNETGGWHGEAQGLRMLP